MATKFLRQIILEELKKVLSEEAFNNPQYNKDVDERLKDFGEDPENMSIEDRAEWIRKNAPYNASERPSDEQLGFADESSVEGQLQARKTGIVCSFASTVQSLIRNKIKLTKPVLVGRVSDGRMGFVTSSIINYVIAYGLKNNIQEAQGLVKIPLTVKGYKNACFRMTKQQQDNLIKLFGKIPVKAIEVATQRAVDERPAEPPPVNITPVPGERPPPEPIPKDIPKAPVTALSKKIGHEIGEKISDSPYLGHVMTREPSTTEPYLNSTIGIWDGTKYTTPELAIQAGIKVPRWLLNINQRDFLEKNYPSLLLKESLKRELARMLKNL